MNAAVAVAKGSIADSTHTMVNGFRRWEYACVQLGHTKNNTNGHAQAHTAYTQKRARAHKHSRTSECTVHALSHGNCVLHNLPAKLSYPYSRTCGTVQDNCAKDKPCLCVLSSSSSMPCCPPLARRRAQFQVCA